MPTLDENALTFLEERHLGTLSVPRPGRSPHVTAVGFTYDPDDGLARVITFAASRKARLLAHGGDVALCQVDGGRWLTVEGRAQVVDDPDRVAAAVARYAARYRQPSERADRVAIEVCVNAAMGRW